MANRDDKEDFDGSLVLEQLALVDKMDDFLEAVDADDFDRAKSLMRFAGIESRLIEIVLKKMEDQDGLD